MGVVYLAKDNILDREVAYKVFKFQRRDDSMADELLLREAKTTAILNHQNIVTLFDVGYTDSSFFLAMEYVEGKSLKQLIKSKEILTTEDIVDVFRQICRALNCAHSKKIVHLDMKPANVMRADMYKIIKIMDFGIAKVLQNSNVNEGTTMFTPQYVAPEQIKGQPVDFRTDIYSLGVSMFELATGKLPFRNGDYLYQHINTPPPVPHEVNPELSERLGNIILKCLKKSPLERYGDVKEILTDLDNF